MSRQKLIILSAYLLTGLFLLFSGIPFALKAQPLTGGKPAITNYSPQDYKGTPYIWAITQDQRGVLYFGNSEGLLEYDGVNWRQLKLPNKSTVRSLATSREGTVYIGGIGELGYLSFGPGGALKFISLLNQLPEEYRNVFDVWEMQVHLNNIYFVTSGAIFCWDGQKMKVIPAEEAFHTSAVVHDQLYVRQWGVGLMKLEGDALRLVPGGERFAEERIYTMLPFDETRMLIGTRNNGLFLYDGQTFTPFTTEADPIIREKQLYHGTALPGGRFALGASAGGLVIINRQGQLLQHLDSRTGLQNEFVVYTYLDREGLLWLGLSKGAARVDIASPLTYFDRSNGVSGNVWDIVQFEGRLYAALDVGVSWFDPLTGSFQPVKGISGQTWQLLPWENELLVANVEKGLQSIRGDRSSVVRASVNYDFRVRFLHAYKKQPGILFCGLSDGLGVLEKPGNGRWNDLGRIGEISNAIDFIIERENGDLWLAARGQTVRVQFPEQDNRIQIDQAIIIPYEPDQGLPSSEGAFPFVFQNSEYFFLPDHGFFRYVPAEDRFVPDTLFQQAPLRGSGALSHFQLEAQNQIWLGFDAGIMYGVPQEDGSYQYETEPFMPFADQSIQDIYPSEEGTVWFGGSDLIIRYDANAPAAAATDFFALIRRITIGDDSLLYNGAGPLPNELLDYDYNSLSFAYAAPTFQQEDKTQYQTWLENFDPGWSHWSGQTARPYTNLPEGTYTFHVRARNVYQITSEEASYTFTILPPWYRTWWAYLLYLLAAAALVFLIVRWRTGQLQAQSEILEKTVAERTAELQLSNEQIRQQAEELATVNEVSRALAEQLQLADLIQLVGDQLRNLFHANIVYVALLDKASSMINFPYQYGDVIKPIRLGEGLTSQIIQTGTPMLINQDLDASYHQLGIERIGKQAASYLGVPIPSGREHIGVLSVQSTEYENRFTENDQKLLATIASHVGLAIHNAQLYEEAQEAKALAEQANEAKSGFLSTVSHELRTPLTSIIGFSKLNQKSLRERILPGIREEDCRAQEAAAKLESNLTIVAAEGERLTMLINDLLDLAKIEAGKVEWKMTEVQPAELIERATAATAALFEQKPGLVLIKEIPNNLPAITADRDRIIQVLINLISNAVKFTEKGKVEVKVEIEKTYLLFAVEDTGSGIPPDQLDQIFEKFRQVDDNQAGKPKGTGLGLPICREIVEHHNGRIWGKSTIGAGSTFFFTLPCAPEQ